VATRAAHGDSRPHLWAFASGQPRRRRPPILAAWRQITRLDLGNTRDALEYARLRNVRARPAWMTLVSVGRMVTARGQRRSSDVILEGSTK
jgi:hypothetical protein